LGKLHLGKLHRERAVTGRIFQALPTQTNTVALIYKISNDTTILSNAMAFLVMLHEMMFDKLVFSSFTFHFCSFFFCYCEK
jgi:hypothetical protein